jgi:hypothetical protein
VGGQTLTFPPFESDHMTCLVSGPDSVDVTLNSLATQGRQLQFDLRPDGDGVIGHAIATDGQDKLRATISTFDGTADGPSFDGATVTFTETFEHTSDADPNLSEELDGTATVTCPKSPRSVGESWSTTGARPGLRDPSGRLVEQS